MRLLSFTGTVLLAAATAAADQNCYCMAHQDCWPLATKWQSLNSTVQGRLVATVPIGTPCHDPTYDAAACAALQQQWTNPLTHIPSSSSIMQSYFANQSCDPFTDRTKPCTLGNYVAYAIKAQSTADVAAALAFAKANNIRVVVRNTGHEFVTLFFLFPFLTIQDLDFNMIFLLSRIVSLVDQLVRMPWPSGRRTSRVSPFRNGPTSSTRVQR